MTFLTRAFFLLLLTLPFPSLGADIVWLKLHPIYQYQDVDFVCTNLTTSAVYLSMEVANGRATRGQLHRSPSYPFSPKLPLSPEELEKMSVQHEGGTPRWWLKRLWLKPETAGWILASTGDGLSPCPTQRLVEANPEIQLSFELEGIPEGILVSHSGRLQFSGKREDGRPYTAELRLTQRPYIFDHR